ncbi:MAG TPA: hypothetical protein PLK08_01850, partial [Phycisphaerae bacterium]|nr:hypothetical protein [Phycisphaerae bacterium]
RRQAAKEPIAGSQGFWDRSTYKRYKKSLTTFVGFFCAIQLLRKSITGIAVLKNNTKMETCNES